MTKKYFFYPGVPLPTYKYMKFHSKQNPKRDFEFSLPLTAAPKKNSTRKLLVDDSSLLTAQNIDGRLLLHGVLHVGLEEVEV